MPHSQQRSLLSEVRKSSKSLCSIVEHIKVIFHCIFFARVYTTAQYTRYVRATPHLSLQPFAPWALRPAALGAAGGHCDKCNKRKRSGVLLWPAKSRQKAPAYYWDVHQPIFHNVHNTGTRRLSIAMAWEERAYELEKTQGEATDRAHRAWEERARYIT